MANPKVATNRSIKIHVEEGQAYKWCACGLSANQPFCDGSHATNTSFKPIEYTASKTGLVSFCGCKHSKDPVICDGSHKLLSGTERTKVVFMGTPSFALPTLEVLLDCPAIDVVAVYTRPPKPAGRGNEVTKSEVHLLAEKYDKVVFTPKTLRSDEEVAKLSAMKPDFIAVAAYGLILPQEVINLPKHCCLNVHPSKLPRWRGAAPIQRTILSGDTNTAMCIMRMDARMDTGDIVLTQDYPIDDEITAKMLHDEMSKLGAKMMLEAMKAILMGVASYTKQSEEGEMHAAKVSREDELLDFTEIARMVNCRIRAFSPRPGAYFTYKGEHIKVIDASVIESAHEGKPTGTVLDDNLLIACANNTAIRLKLLQRSGRKMIYTEAFLRGFPINKGEVL